MLSNSKYNT